MAEVTLSHAVKVLMPDGRNVHLHKGRNIDVDDDVAAHWFVRAATTTVKQQPPLPQEPEVTPPEEGEIPGPNFDVIENSHVGDAMRAEIASKAGNTRRKRITE